MPGKHWITALRFGVIARTQFTLKGKLGLFRRTPSSIWARRVRRFFLQNSSPRQRLIIFSSSSLGLRRNYEATKTELGQQSDDEACSSGDADKAAAPYRNKVRATIVSGDARRRAAGDMAWLLCVGLLTLAQSK